MLNLFSFAGRQTRSQCWKVQNWLSVYLAAIIIPVMYVTAKTKSVGHDGVVYTTSISLPGFVWIAVIILVVPALWMSLASYVKRYHDLGKSGHWMYLCFLPGGAFWVAIELSFFRGTPGPNEYDAPISLPDVFMDEKEYANATSGANSRVSRPQNDRKSAPNQPGRDVGGAPLFGKRGRQATN